jgi:hypothetical protein
MTDSSNSQGFSTGANRLCAGADRSIYLINILPAIAWGSPGSQVPERKLARPLPFLISTLRWSKVGADSFCGVWRVFRRLLEYSGY